MAKTQTATSLDHNSGVIKKNIQYRTHSIRLNCGGKKNRIEVDLDIPIEKILEVVCFDSALLNRRVVEAILSNALTESRQGKIQRKWSFEFVSIKIDDPFGKEFSALQDITESISRGEGVAGEVQTLESFLNPQTLSVYLSTALSNKKLEVLTPLEIIFFAYARKMNGADVFMPHFPEEYITRYCSSGGLNADTLKGIVPRIIFPGLFKRVRQHKVYVKGHVLSAAEIEVRTNRNSSLVYKINSSLN